MLIRIFRTKFLHDYFRYQALSLLKRTKKLSSIDQKSCRSHQHAAGVSIFPVFKVIIASTTVVRFRFKSKQEIIISRVKNKTLRAPLKTHSMSSHDFLCNYNHMGRFLISNTDPAGSIFSVGFGDNREPSPVISVERDELY